MAESKPPLVPYISTKEMIEVDRAMIEDYKIELIQMMENAGRNLARLATEKLLGGSAYGKKVVVLAGTGRCQYIKPIVHLTSSLIHLFTNNCFRWQRWWCFSLCASPQ